MNIFKFFRAGNIVADNVAGRNIVIRNSKIVVDGVEISDTQDALTIRVEGVVENLTTDMSVNCLNVTGNVTAKGSVNADAIGGNVEAGGSVNCDDVAGDVKAGGSVNCDDVRGSVTAKVVVR